jgi:hypothetical protein
MAALEDLGRVRLSQNFFFRDFPAHLADKCTSDGDCIVW